MTMSRINVYHAHISRFVIHLSPTDKSLIEPWAHVYVRVCDVCVNKNSNWIEYDSSKCQINR